MSDVHRERRILNATCVEGMQVELGGDGLGCGMCCLSNDISSERAPACRRFPKLSLARPDLESIYTVAQVVCRRDIDLDGPEQIIVETIELQRLFYLATLVNGHDGKSRWTRRRWFRFKPIHRHVGKHKCETRRNFRQRPKP